MSKEKKTERNNRIGESLVSILPYPTLSPRETSDRAEVNKKGFVRAVVHDKRECRTVRAYGT
jgi:hypothetical protein